MALLLVSSAGAMWYFGGSKVWSLAPALLLSAVGMLLFFLRPFLFPEVDRLPVPPGGWAGLLALALVMAWLPFAPVRFDAIVTALKIGSAVAAYWLWAALAAQHGRWRWLLGLLIFGATLMGWYALIQHGHESNMVLYRTRPEQYGMRASGAYVCPNHFAHMIAMIMTLAFALLRCRDAGFALRALCGYAWVVLGPALYLSQSRSGWLALIAGVLTVLAAYGWRRGPGRFALNLAVGALVVGGLAYLLWLVSPVVQARVQDALRGDIRPAMWRDTLAMIQAQPWLGHGPGSYRWIIADYYHHFRHYLDPEYAHNEFLHAAAEYGIPGALLFVLPFAVAAIILLIRLRRAGREKEVSLSAAALGVWAASAVHAGFDYNLQIYANLHTLALISGVAVSGLVQGGAEIRGWPRAALRASAAFGLLATLALGVGALRSWMGWQQADRADLLRTELQPERARAAYLSARRWAPWYAQPALGLGDLARSRAFWIRDPDRRVEAADEALRWYEEAKRLNPWEFAADFGRSRVLRHLGRNEESLAVLAALVERRPLQAYYQAQLGLALLQEKRYAAALLAFQRSQELSPSPLAQGYIQWLREQMTIRRPARPPSASASPGS